MRKAITIALIMIVAICTACNKKQVNKQNEKLFYAIEEENYQAVKECLEDKNLDLEHLKLSDRTQFAKKDQRALGLAMEQISEIEGSEQISLLLIKAGADVNSFKGLNTYLQIAASNKKYELVKALVEAGASVNKRGKENGYRALDQIVSQISTKDEKDSQQIIEYLTKKGAIFDNDTLKSVMNGEWRYKYTTKIIKEIKKQGNTIKISKALEAAIEGNNKDLQKYIRDKKINKKDEKNIILYASANCNLRTVKMLYQEGYDFKIVDDYAVISGNEKKYKYLSKQKSTKINQKSMWEAATIYGNEDSIRLLKENLYKPNETEILQGYMQGNDKAIKGLINQKYTINIIKGDFISRSSIRTIKKLYQKTNVKISQDEMESLVIARENKFIKAIIKEKRYQGTQNKERLLYYAVDTGNLELVKYFIKLGADINKVIEIEGNQSSALHRAAERSSKEILKYMINKGGDIHKKNGEGKDAIQIAKDGGYEENEKLLKGE